jgi:hypothetical protein
MNPLLVNVALLLGAALIIYFACEFFVNGVEWLGRKLSVGRTATGTILAACGIRRVPTVQQRSQAPQLIAHPTSIVTDSTSIWSTTNEVIHEAF